MNKSEKELIMDLILKKIDNNVFLKKISVPINTYMKESMEKIISEEDGEGVSSLLRLGARFNFDDHIIKLLCSILDYKWHTRQEEIARILQHRIHDEICVEKMVTAMQDHYENMPSDDLRFPFVIKCAYALADSNLELAHSQLKTLAQSKDPVVSAATQWQLDRLAGKNPEPLDW